MDKQCRNCGADLPEGASFCPHCAQSQIERQEVKPPRLWRKKALIAALCAHVLVTAALAVFNAVTVGIGEVISCTILGVALVKLIETNASLKKIFTEE